MLELVSEQIPESRTLLIDDEQIVTEGVEYCLTSTDILPISNIQFESIDPTNLEIEDTAQRIVEFKPDILLLDYIYGDNCRFNGGNLISYLRYLQVPEIVQNTIGFSSNIRIKEEMKLETFWLKKVRMQCNFHKYCHTRVLKDYYPSDNEATEFKKFILEQLAVRKIN